MTRTAKFLLTAAALGIAAPAFAAVVVVGNSSARLCYEAADSKLHPRPTDFDRCNEAFERENLNRHDLVATYVNRGILKFKVRNYDSALQDFDKALAIDPNQAEGYLNKAATLLRLPGGSADALPLFSTAIAKKTQRPAIAYYGRAIANELNGNIKQAYLDYRMASRLDPTWDDPQNELARFTVRQP